MRILAIVVAIIVALAAFAIIKLIGFVLQIALVGAAVVLAAGLLIARTLRRT